MIEVTAEVLEWFRSVKISPETFARLSKEKVQYLQEIHDFAFEIGWEWSSEDASYQGLCFLSKNVANEELIAEILQHELEARFGSVLKAADLFALDDIEAYRPGFIAGAKAFFERVAPVV